MGYFEFCRSGQATRGRSHHFPVAQQQFKHIGSLLILKLKWNDITFQLSFSFRTRLSVWVILSCARAGRQPAGGGGQYFPLLQQQFKHIESLLILKLKWNDITFQVSSSFRTRLSVWIILICAGAGSQPAGGGH
jgi:hypothetical protein